MPAVAQAGLKSINTGTSFANSNPFASNVVSGNVLGLFVCGWINAATTNWTVSDATNGAWTQIGTNTTESGGGYISALFYVKNTLSGALSLSVSNDSAGGGITALPIEVSGQNATTPFVSGETGKQTGASNGSGVTPVTSPDVTNSNANSIFWGGCESDAATTDTEADSPNNSWANQKTEQRGLSGFIVGNIATLIVSSSAARNETWTIRNAVGSTSAIADFQQATGGAAAVPPPQRTLRGAGV